MSESTPAARLVSRPFEGPCVARAEDLPDVVSLANQVFRPSPRPGDMGSEFPILLGPANLGNQYIFRDGGQVASHVGMLRQTIHTLGVDIPVACIGSVCTHPDYRQGGLAGRLMDLAIQRSIEAGDVLMPISGKRTLYVSRGATSLGPQIRLKVPIQPDMAGAADFAVCAFEPADWPRLAALQARQSIRYAWSDREPQVLESIRRWGGVCLLASHKDGELAAALLFCVNHPMYGGKDGFGRVVQFLGDVAAIPACLARAARDGLTGMEWTVLATAYPKVARTLLSAGATGPSQLTAWTVLVLKLAKLIEKIGPAVARAGVELSARDGQLTIAAGEQSVTLADRESQIELLFRHPGTWSPTLAGLPRELRIACSVALPVPLPDYGINYV